MTLPSDKELLKLAAKAADIKLEWFEVEVGDPDCDAGWHCDLKGTRKSWNPITDAGDALRLAVRLGMLFTYMKAEFEMFQKFYLEELDNDLKPSEATRRAIVRAAAEIGRAMP